MDCIGRVAGNALALSKVSVATEKAGRETLKIFFLGKRYYTNKDLLKDRFGRLYHLPVRLARLGADVSVAAIDYRNPDSQEMAVEGVVFRTAPAIPFRLFSLPFHLYHSAQAANADIIIASGDSHIGYIGLRIARRLCTLFVYDVYDYYPAFSGNRIPGMKAMFRSTVKRADLLLCASEPLRHTLSDLNQNILLVENGVDRTLFAPGDMKTARKRLGLEDETPLVGYFGSITPTRGPLLIDACRQLRREMPSLRLVLAGRVAGLAIAEPWISYLGELPQASVPELIRACDVVTVPYADDAFNSMAGPCKIAEYLACGKPVVATRVSGHEQIFKDAPSSLCDPDPDDMATAIRRQLANPEVVSFPEYLSWSHIARTLYDALLAISKQGTHA